MKYSIRELLQGLDIKADFRGEEAYLTKSDFGSFVEACEMKNLAIIGIEAVRIDRGITEPYPSLIADFSELKSKTWSGYVTKCNMGARLFMGKLPEVKGLRVLVTIYTEEEWSQAVSRE